MEWKMITIEESAMTTKKRDLVPAKLAIFTFDGSEHSLLISMEDFNAGKTRELVQAVVDKLQDALGKK